MHNPPLSVKQLIFLNGQLLQRQARSNSNSNHTDDDDDNDTHLNPI
jgi:hypothetical protein